MNPESRDRRSFGAWLRRGLRVLWRAAQVGLLLLAMYGLLAALGMIPFNNNFTPATEGIEILLVSNPIHADVLVPIETDAVDWREHFPSGYFQGDTRGASHIAFGWGDRRFYTETPTWREFEWGTAGRALFWPTEACMRVVYTREEYVAAHARSVTISPEQYERLVEYLRDSFQRTADGSPIRIREAAYGTQDAFFEARGSYHCFNTCNCWLGRALLACGVRTGWWTPLPRTPLFYLPATQEGRQETAGTGHRSGAGR